MIQTSEYALTKKEYLKVQFLTIINLYQWSYITMIVGALLLIPLFERSHLAAFLVLYVPFYFIFTTYQVISYAGAKENQNIYRTKQLTIQSDKIISYSGKDSVFNTPTTNEYAFDQIVKAKQVSGFWLLFLEKNYFLIIPQYIFQSIEDREAFEKLIRLQ